MAVETQNLYRLLENAHTGFAYQLLALQMQVETRKQDKDGSLIQQLTKLIQLYMLGVEVLQSNYDKRYKYFNDKIQGLMKKKHVIEQLHIASTGMKQVPADVLVEANKEDFHLRKNEHEINIFMSSDQCNIQRVKQFMKKQQLKTSDFRSKVKLALDAQDQKINSRIQRRKMKSQCYSRRGPFDKNTKYQDHDDIFESELNASKRVTGVRRKNSSTQKKKTVDI